MESWRHLERHGDPYLLSTFWAASTMRIVVVAAGLLAIVSGLSRREQSSRSSPGTPPAG
jgi:hypothetical protein